MASQLTYVAKELVRYSTSWAHGGSTPTFPEHRLTLTVCVCGCFE